MVIFDRCTNCTLQPDYVSTLSGKTKNGTKTAAAYAVHSVELIVPDFWRKSFNVRFFPYSLEISLAVFQQKIFYILVGFIKILSWNSIWLIPVSIDAKTMKIDQEMQDV